MKILVIQQKMIGDVLTSSLICEVLKTQNATHQVHYMVHSSTKPVIENNPFIDTIIDFKPAYREDKKAFFSFLKKIRNEKYDWVIDVYGKLETNLICLFSGAKKRTSYKKWYSSFIYNDLISPKLETLTNAGLAIENRLRLVFLETEIPAHITAPKIHLKATEIETSKTLLENAKIDLSKPLIMISVLGSEKRKTLPAKAMAKIIDEIVATTDATILYNYIPPQAAEAKEIFDFSNQKTQNNTRFDVLGKSLREFICILYHCNTLIGNEGGAVNMAKALNKPTFTIFSPWILQHGWNLFEDGVFHKSVHLKQYKPALYENKSGKQLKETALELYDQFNAELILPELTTYLKGIAL